MKHSGIIFIIIALLYNAHGETGWRTFTIEDGLADSNITCIVMDSTGALWFGTYNNGISRYDFKEWSTYDTTNGLSSNNILSAVVDDSGNVLVGTDDGDIFKFDGKTWSNFLNLFGDSYISFLTIDNYENIWIGDFDYCRKYDVDTIFTYKARDTIDGIHVMVSAIAFDIYNNVWIVSRYWEGPGFGISPSKDCVKKFDGYEWENFYPSDGLLDENIYSLAIDDSNYVWVGTKYGINKFDGESWIVYDTINNLHVGIVYSILIDDEGNIWFGTDNGIFKFDYSLWDHYDTINGLCNNYVKAICQDRFGNMWFGTEGGGVSFYGELDNLDQIRIYIDSKNKLKEKDYIRVYADDNIVNIVLNKSIKSGEIKVYNIKGRLKYSNNNLKSNKIIWNTKGLPSGFYVLNIKSGNNIYIKKILLGK